MLFGVGCDLCEIARMEQSLFGPHGEAFEARVFGEAERQALALDSCREAPKKAKNDHGDTVRQSALNVSRRARKAASAAADFAAKEALLKAAGTGLREPFALRDIEAVRRESGAPADRLSGATARWVADHGLTAHLSLSHDGGMALAFCILETAPET